MKPCSKCGVDKELSTHFNKNSNSPDGFFYWCRDCQKSHYKLWRQANKSRESEKDKQLYAVRYQEIEKLKEKPCADCGVCYPPYVMDFDHVRGEKKFLLSRVGGSNWKRVLDEAAKCDVVCANCHRIRTHERKKNAEAICKVR